MQTCNSYDVSLMKTFFIIGFLDHVKNRMFHKIRTQVTYRNEVGKKLKLKITICEKYKYSAILILFVNRYYCRKRTQVGDVAQTFCPKMLLIYAHKYLILIIRKWMV